MFFQILDLLYLQKQVFLLNAAVDNANNWRIGGRRIYSECGLQIAELACMVPLATESATRSRISMVTKSFDPVTTIESATRLHDASIANPSESISLAGVLSPALA